MFSLVRTVPDWGEFLTDHPLKFDIWVGGAYVEQILTRNDGFGFQTKYVGESVKILNVKCNLTLYKRLKRSSIVEVERI